MYRKEIAHVNIQVFQDYPNIILTRCNNSSRSKYLDKVKQRVESEQFERSSLGGCTNRLVPKFTQAMAGNSFVQSQRSFTQNCFLKLNQH